MENYGLFTLEAEEAIKTMMASLIEMIEAKAPRDEIVSALKRSIEIVADKGSLEVYEAAIRKGIVRELDFHLLSNGYGVFDCWHEYPKAPWRRV